MISVYADLSTELQTVLTKYVNSLFAFNLSLSMQLVYSLRSFLQAWNEMCCKSNILPSFRMLYWYLYKCCTNIFYVDYFGAKIFWKHGWMVAVSFCKIKQCIYSMKTLQALLSVISGVDIYKDQTKHSVKNDRVSGLMQILTERYVNTLWRSSQAQGRFISNLSSRLFKTLAM